MACAVKRRDPVKAAQAFRASMEKASRAMANFAEAVRVICRDPGDVISFAKEREGGVIKVAMIKRANPEAGEYKLIAVADNVWEETYPIYDGDEVYHDEITDADLLGCCYDEVNKKILFERAKKKTGG